MSSAYSKNGHAQRIGLNLLYLLPGQIGGTETYAEGLIGAFEKIAKNRQFFVFVNLESSNWPLPQDAAWTRVVCPVRANQRALRYRYEQFFFPAMLKRHNLDVVHSLNYVGPLFTKVPHVVTIHDMNTFGHREAMSWRKRLPLRFFQIQTAKRCDHIITDSNFSKNEINKYIKLPAEKTSVAWLAPAPGLLSSKKSGSPNECERRPYILCLSSISPHKNIEKLIRAFGKIAHHIPHQLIIAGKLPAQSVLEKSINELGLQNKIITTGFISNEQLSQLYCDADIFVFPSLYEGFGLPALEAQIAGTCVACSSAGALPEIAGEGAAYFDPRSEESISRTILSVLNEPNYRMDLIVKGNKNISRFSWKNCALETLEVYDKIFNKTRLEISGL